MLFTTVSKTVFLRGALKYEEKDWDK
jgi:hypothetical protein